MATTVNTTLQDVVLYVIAKMGECMAKNKNNDPSVTDLASQLALNPKLVDTDEFQVKLLPAIDDDIMFIVTSELMCDSTFNEKVLVAKALVAQTTNVGDDDEMRK